MKKLISITLAIACFVLPHSSKASIVSKTMYLNKGNFMAVDSTTFPAYAFNATAVYSPMNETVVLNAGDQLAVTIINTDTIQHGFTVNGIAGASFFIAALDTVTDTISFPTMGVFIFRDHQNDPTFTYMGAAGIICVETITPDFRYFWNFHEFNKQWNIDLDAGTNVNWNNFDPDYFTVNGSSYPFIDNDNTAKVTGSVGDTIYIYCANTGRSVHSVHFHGYHCRIVYSSKNNQQVNWMKDSVPLWFMETMILELVPDKPGLFPVHDHNLMAQTGNRYYNHGIMLMMDIQ